jgi:hypothetical protein
MPCKLVVGLMLLLGVSGCYTLHSATRKEYSTIYSKKSGPEFIRIRKVFDSQCRCVDVIAEKYVYRKIRYRLHYGCGLYKTRKMYYHYCSRGALVLIRSFEGSSEPWKMYHSKLDALDKFVLHKIDSFIQVEDSEHAGNSFISRFKLCRKEINSFKIINR